LGEFRYSFGDFPTPDILPLYKSFSIDDYKEDVKKLENINVEGIIYVQVYHTEEETGKIEVYHKFFSINWFFNVLKNK
jgi:hypothetical protein